MIILHISILIVGIACLVLVWDLRKTTEHFKDRVDLRWQNRSKEYKQLERHIDTILEHTDESMSREELLEKIISSIKHMLTNLINHLPPKNGNGNGKYHKIPKVTI